MKLFIRAESDHYILWQSQGCLACLLQLVILIMSRVRPLLTVDAGAAKRISLAISSVLFINDIIQSIEAVGTGQDCGLTLSFSRL